MRKYCGGLAGAGRTRQAPAWINSWLWQHNAWHLRILHREHGTWLESITSPQSLVKARTFEPSTPGVPSLPTENRRFEIPDLSVLSRLLEPREIVGPILGKALHADHAIYVADSNEGRVYFPAWLLLDHLWLWSADALRTVLTPNSLDVYMGAPASDADGLQQALNSRLVPPTGGKTARHRVTWLIRRADARASFASVLTYAYQNRVDLMLPQAKFSGWLWGVHLRSGLLACELDSVDVSFESHANQAHHPDTAAGFEEVAVNTARSHVGG